MKKQCIVNVATGFYVKGQRRLLAGLKRIGYGGDILTWTDELPLGSPTHDESPMGFKPVTIKQAKDAGYKQILWLDANCIPIRSLDGIFDTIKRDGYFIYSLGSNFGEWCSDIALDQFGISREKSFDIMEINTSCLGLGVDHTDSMKFLREWETYSRNGKAFRGIDRELPLSRTNDNRDGQVSVDSRVKGHRHDQTVASFLTWKYRFKLSGMEIANYQAIGANGENVYSKTIPLTAVLLHNRDTKRDDFVFLDSVDRFGNTRGIRKLIFILLSLVATVRKYASCRSIVGRTRGKNYYIPGSEKDTA